MNVDRTARNPNLLRYLSETWLIDHGASLYFHHQWNSAQSKIASPFPMIRDHVLLTWAGDIATASKIAHQKLNQAELQRVVDLVPAGWLTHNNDIPAEAWRDRYVQFLAQRLENSVVFEEEVRRARPGSV